MIPMAWGRMAKHTSKPGYGGLEKAAVSEFCHKLLEVVESLPISDDLEQRRDAALDAVRAAQKLAEADPNTPLSNSLFALVGATQCYIILGTAVTEEAEAVRDALETIR
jgi:hypothetical protein